MREQKNNFITITTRINHNVYVRSDLQKVLKLPIHIKVSDEGDVLMKILKNLFFIHS